MTTLHIVDGESTGGSLRQAGLSRPRDILSWRDALYTGPVPSGLTLRQLSILRSRFWTGRNATAFDKRDARLSHRSDYDEVVLWFGPTSLCQLSLVQLLAWFKEHNQDNGRLRLVSAYGGLLKPEELLLAYDARRPISPAQIGLARRVWFAFCSPSPKPLSRLLSTELGALPEIRETIKHLLQEYPERQSGLSRLERKLLRATESLGVTTPAAVVVTTLRTELVGDALLFDMLRAFVTATHPRLRFAEPFKANLRNYQFNGSRIAVSDAGRAVLAGESDHVRLNGINRWIGGVHLQGNRVPWRWDERSGRIVNHNAR